MNYFLSYEEAKNYVLKLQIKSASKWREYSKTKRPSFLPGHPDIFYKHSGWINWNDWLGNNNKQGGQRKYDVNEDFFSSWSHDMAYIFGFWCADGYINKKQWLFSITQHENEKYLLEKILRIMGSNSPVFKHYYNNLVIRIGSKKIVEDLEKLGAKQSKTFNLTFPDVPNEFLSDFIRGFWDGDGSIYKDKRYDSYQSSCLCASSKFVLALKEVLENNIDGFHANIYTVKNKYYLLSVNTNNARRLRDFLYQDPCSLFMKRKKKLFEKTGEINIASYNRIFLPFDEARKFTRQLRLHSYGEWRKYRKSKEKPDDIPSHPEKIYEDCGWIGYADWLGNEMWSYETSKNHIRKLGINSQAEWVKYAKTKRPRNIPSNPWTFYDEWVNLENWLGKEK